MLTITSIPAFRDNYIWLIGDSDSPNVYLVDPGSADEVIEVLAHQGLELKGILVTHHHSDHVGGIAALQAYVGSSLPVYGPAAENISAINRPLMGDEVLSLPHLGIEAQVMKVPGHTAGHIAYHIGDNVFCGDTLFSGGCGRLFEGTAKQMWHSLSSLAQLPAHTRVYCAHEYTQSNLNFALTVESNNSDLVHYSQWVDAQRSAGKSTIPSTIGLERQINPFLRCHLPSIKAAVAKQAQQTPLDDVATFALLRQWKDKF